MTVKPKKYVVFLGSLGYPQDGYYVEAQPVPHMEFGDFLDTLPAELVDYVIVDANNIPQAKALGLKGIYKRAKNGVKTQENLTANLFQQLTGKEPTAEQKRKWRII
jgi:hypothetical protein